MKFSYPVFQMPDKLVSACLLGLARNDSILFRAHLNTPFCWFAGSAEVHLTKSKQNMNCRAA